MYNNVSSIVLAAGCSKRFLSSHSKQSHKIGNLEIVNHTCNNLAKCSRIIVVTTQRTSQINIKAKNHEKILQRSTLGTGAAIKDALSFSSLVDSRPQWILICYADMPLIHSSSFEKAIEQLISRNYQSERYIGVILSAEKNDEHVYGRLILDQEGNVVGIAEADILNDAIPANHSISNMINAAIAIKADMLYKYISYIKPCHNGEERITDLIKILTQDKYRFGYHVISQDEAHGVNTVEDLAICERIFQDRARKKHRAIGCIMPDAESVFFSHDTYVEKDVIVMPNVYFGESVVIKSGSVIQPFCVLSHCVVEQSVVGPFAHIRNNAQVYSSTIGNFVEIKTSTIQHSSKIKHLSYIGDAEIAENVNIGAGVITCNYDGFQKNRTCIGKDSFVGAGSTLLAPITIGESNFVAAGSVVQKSVMSRDNLIISRSVQQVIQQGFSRYKQKKQKEVLQKKSQDK